MNKPFHRPARRLRPLLMAGGLLALSACGGGEPFLDFYPQREPNVLPMQGTRTTAAVCYSGKDPKTREIRALAAAHCAQIGQVAKFSSFKEMRCTPTTPHVAYYSCVQPKRQATSDGTADITPGSISPPAPAWDPNAVAPPPPDAVRATPRAAPWDPTAAPVDTIQNGTSDEAAPAPSWDEGTTGAPGAFPTNAITNLPRL